MLHGKTHIRSTMRLCPEIILPVLPTIICEFSKFAQICRTMKQFQYIISGHRTAIAAMVLYIASLSASAAQEMQKMQDSGRFAVVSLSVNFLREKPDYTAELGTQALMGTIVEITGEQGYWKQVVTPEPYRAWCSGLGIVEMSGKQIEEYMNAPKYICTAWHSTVYAAPATDSGKICDIVEGDIVRIAFRNRKGRSNEIRQKAAGQTREGGTRLRPAVIRGFAKILLPDGTEGYVRKGDLREYTSWQASLNPTAENIIEEALKFTGVPYMWGGASPNGVDCSGLVRHVFMMNGIMLPRNASQQAKEGMDIGLKWKIPVQGAAVDSPDMEPCGTGVIDSSEFRKGDLLFFGKKREDGTPAVTHVGIYIGDGKFIHSSQYVRTSSLDPASGDYYENTPKLLFCRRILQN